MCGCFGCLGKMIGAFLALIFVFSFAGALWAYNINRAVHSTDSGIDALIDQDFYDSVLPLVLPALAENPDQQFTIGKLEFSSIVENLEYDDWKAIAQEVVPGDYLQEQTEENLAITLEYLRGERARLDAEFDTYVLRDNLLGQPGDSMVHRIVDTWPGCDEAGVAQIKAFLAEESSDFPYCKPSDPALQREVFTLLNTAKDDLAQDIPEYWNVRREYAANNGLTPEEADRQLYETMQRPSVLQKELNGLNILLNAAWLALIVIFAVESGKSFLRWIGSPLFITGIVVLLPLGVIPLLAPAFNADQGRLNSIESETVRGVVLSLVSEFTMPILVQGALLVIIGFVMLFISFLLHDDETVEFTEPMRQTGSHPMMQSAQPVTAQHDTTPTGSMTVPLTPSRIHGQSTEANEPPSQDS